MDRITLKNIKYSEFASEETFCYEASVYFDGKRIGTVKNNGHGGADYEYPTNNEKWAEAEAYAATLKSPPNPYDGNVYSESLETICHHRVAEWLEKRDYQREVRKIKRQLKTRTIFRVSADNVREIKQPISDRIREHVMGKYPNAQFLNDMEIDDAVSCLVQ